MRRWAVGLAFVLLGLAGAAFGVLGFRGLALERGEASRRAEERAAAVAKQAAAWAEGRAAAPGGEPAETWTVAPAPTPAALSDDESLLVREAEWRERVRGDSEAALTTLLRFARAAPPTAATPVAALRAGAIERGLGREADARRDLAVAADAPADLGDERGVPIRLAARWLLAAGDPAARERVAEEAGDGRVLVLGDGPTASDLVVALGDLPAAGRARLGLACLAALPADGTAAVGGVVATRSGDRIEVRPPSVLLRGFPGDPDVTVRLAPEAAVLPPDRETPLGGALRGLAAVAHPDRWSEAGPGPWMLGLGLGVYLLGLALAAGALVRGARTARLQADFVAAVSHELKTPIASVRAMAELLADGAAQDPEMARRYAERIGFEMERLGSSVRNVLDAARIERTGTLPVTLRPGDPARVVQEALDAFAPALDRRGGRLAAEVRAAPAPVPIDPEAMRGVLANLLDNALKYGGEAKRVEVEAGPAADGRYRIAVLDRGVGIPEAERERLFGRFFRGRAAREGAVPGVGLGLHVARGVVEAHGGTIRAEAREGGGTAFVVDLPSGGAT